MASLLSAQERVKLVLRVVDADTGLPVAGYKAKSVVMARTGSRTEEKATNEWAGDAKGEATVDFAPPKENGYYNRHLQIEHSDYVPLSLIWYAPPRTSRGPLPPVFARQDNISFPAEYAVRLDKGVPIGGIVKDSTGKPMAGVRVYPLSSGSFGSPRISPAWPLAYSWDDRDALPHVTTDAQGCWQWTRFPRSYPNVSFAFVQPDHSFTIFRLRPTNRESMSSPAGRGSLLNVDALLARGAEVVLPAGYNVAGVIVDPDGKPLSGATVTERHGNQPMTVSRFTTGPDGRFKLEHRPFGELVLVVQAAGFATMPAVLKVLMNITSARIQVQPTRPLTTRIVDEAGLPVTGAKLSFDSLAGQRLNLDWQGAATDAEGRFRWDDAPHSAIKFSIVATNYGMRKVELHNGEPEQTITLRKENAERIRLVVRAISAETKQPVLRFTVKTAGEAPFGFKFSAQGIDGKMDAVLEKSAWGVDYYPNCRLLLIAEGYAPHVFDLIDFYVGDRELGVELKRGAPGTAGTALLPGGKPAPGARVILTERNFTPFSNKPGEFDRSGSRGVRITADAVGGFTLPPEVRESRLVITHPDGFAAVSVAELRATPQVRLQSWGRIGGVALETGRPLASERISLTTPFSGGEQPFNLIYSTNTTVEGRFSFAMLPPGDYLLCRTPGPQRSGPVVWSHQQSVVVKAGEHAQVTYGGTGRTVIGRAETVPPGGAVDWQWDRNALTLSRSELPPPDFSSFASNESFAAAQKAFYESPEWRRHKLGERNYVAVFAPDGNFRIADVPPGKYEFAIRLTAPPANRRSFSFGQTKELGYARREVVIPDGPPAQLIDFGVILVPLTASVPMAAALPPFEASTLDGKPLRIADYRDKQVLVVFWAAWCRATAEALPELRKAYDAFRGDSRVAMVGVSLDESPTVARAFAEKNGLPWATGWLDAAGQARAASVFGVKGTPTVFLFDRAGQVVARDLQVSNLKVTIQTALRGK